MRAIARRRRPRLTRDTEAFTSCSPSSEQRLSLNRCRITAEVGSRGLATSHSRRSRRRCSSRPQASGRRARAGVTTTPSGTAVGRLPRGVGRRLSEPAPHHARHYTGRPPRRVRLARERDTRYALPRGRALRAGRFAGAADAAGALLAVHREVPAPPRRSRQRWLLSRPARRRSPSG